MIIDETAPCKYFSSVQLLESQLVRFRMRPSQQLLDVVVIFTAESISEYFSYLSKGGAPSEYRCKTVDFRLLRFTDVQTIRTQLGANVPKDRQPTGTLDEEWAAHEKTLLAQTRLVTDASCAQRQGRFEATMYFDSFGAHVWDFQKLFVGRRVADIQQHGPSQIDYRDTSTGMLLEPSDPFADLMI